MGQHNLHFSDKEAAQNWSENYGGQFYDNMHSRGENGSSTNYTVTEQFDDGYCEEVIRDHNITKVFPEGLVVYHFSKGKGAVYYRDSCDRSNGYFFVSFSKNHESYNSHNYDDQTVNIPLLSFTPYTLESGGFSRNSQHKTFI